MLASLKERFSPRKTEKRKGKRQRRAMQFEMLERRVLPSAGGIIASQMAKHVADAHAAPPAHVRWDANAARQASSPAAQKMFGETASPFAAVRHNLDFTAARQAWAARQAAAQANLVSQKTVQEIVFVDPSVSDYKQLINDMVRGSSDGTGQGATPARGNGDTASGQAGTLSTDDNGRLIVVLNPNKDGLDQITQVLSRYQGVSAVYILSHGAQGLVTLGTTDLTDAVLQSRLSEVSGWKASLAPGADILLYACDVAGNQGGVRFVNDLAAATGAVVGAPTKDMGGGSDATWALGYSTGVITAAPPFSATSVAGYGYLLADHVATPNATLTGGNGSDNYIFYNGWGQGNVVDTGTTGTNTLDFSNVTANLTFTLHTNGTVSVTDGAGDTLNNIANMQRVIGGSGTNRFVFDNGATFGGAIIGGSGGTNTLDYSAYTTVVTVSLPAGAATGTQGVSNINGVVGSVTANTTLAFSNGWGTDSIAATGIKTLDFSAVTSNLTFNINADGTVSVVDGGANSLSDIADATGVKGVGSIVGGSGTNSFVFANGAAFSGTINGGSGASTLDYSAYTTGVTVNLQTGTATGTLGVSNIRNITGGSGNDTLTGDTHNNVIIAGSGNDVITGGGGNDTLEGGSGSDTFKFSNAWGIDTVTESSSTGTLDFSAVTSNLTFTIGAGGTVSVTDGSGDTVSTVTGVEGLIGGSGSNAFVLGNGAAFAGTIDGGKGGTNTLNYSAYTTAVAVNFTTGTATGTTGFSDIGNVVGGSGSNTFAFGTSSDDEWGNVTVSGAGANTLDFSAISSDTDLAFSIHADGTVSANDGSQQNTLGNAANVAVIIGGHGSNTFAFDDHGHFGGTINGGSGTSNTLDYSAYTTGVTVNLQTGAATGTGGISNIQNVTGGSGDDTLTGSTAGSIIVGGGGDDVIVDGGGTSTLSDGGGNDTFEFLNGWGTHTTVANTGATGTQTLDFSGVSSNLTVIINTDGTVSVSDALGDTLTSVANMQGVMGGTGTNAFVFQNQATFDGTLTGTGANSTLDYSAYKSAVEVNLSLGTATGTTGISNIWNATGGSGDNTLIGDQHNNILIGGPANNMFTGGGGTDTIIGNTTGTNTLVETWDAAGMTLTNSSFTVTNGATTLGVDNLTNIQAAILTGGLHSTTIDASQFSGSVTLDAGSQALLSALNNGFSTTDATEPDLTGSTLLSALNDGAGVHFAGSGVNDFEITLTDGHTFNVSLYGATTLQNVFDSITSAAAAAGYSGRVSVGIDTQQGDSIVITDTAGDGSNSISVTPLNGSTAASDLGINCAGNGDTLIGSSIAEVTADIRVTMTDGTPVDIDLSGLDTVQDVLAAFNVANSKLSAAINATGTGINVSDTAGGGNNITIADMNGSTAGADLGIVGTGTGNVLHGTSIVSGSVSTGGGNITLDGRFKSDTLKGGTGANTYTGGGGPTTIVGQGTNNTVVETRGDDSYTFTLTNSTLTIADSTSGVTATENLTGVQHATLTAGNGTDTMDASAFTAGSVILTVGDGNNDTLKGGSGDDTLYAGNGNYDTLTGGAGNDTLTVGTGAGDSIDGGTGTNTFLEVGDHRYTLTDTSFSVGQGTDEVENVTLASTVTGGVFTLAYQNQTTIAIPYNATAGVVQADLVALSNIGSGNVEVAAISNGWAVTFTGNLAGLPETITANGSGLTGGGVTVTEAVHGAPQTPDTISNIQNAQLYAVLAGVTMDASGFSGTATLSGGEGNNTLIAGSGTTTMIGGAEDNTFYGGTGTDTITGNATGTNTLIETHDANMTLTNTSLSVTGGLTKTDTLTDIQKVELTGGASANTLDASAFDGVYTNTELQSINNGNGIGTTSGPDIKITLSDGSSDSVDLSSAFTVQDVLNAIGAADSRLTATLGSSGAISISDTAGGSGNLTVANCTGSTAATDLGIAGTGTGASLTGTPISCGSVTFYGSAGNDTIKGSAHATSTLVESWDANMTLTDTSLTATGGVTKTDTLTNIGYATLTNSGPDVHTLDASTFSGPVTLVSGGGTDTLKGAMGGNNEFDVNISSLTSGQHVTVSQGGGTNNRVVITGMNTIDSSSLDWITWSGTAGTLVLDGGANAVVSADIIAAGQNLTIEGDTVTISGHTVSTSSTTGAAGNITIQGYTIDIDNGAQILATGATAAQDGSITINAYDDRAHFTTGFANIDNVNASVNIGTTSGATISGGNVTIEATGYSHHYFQVGDFQVFDVGGSLKSGASIAQEAVDGVLGGLESLSLFAGVTISKSTATIDIGQNAYITAAGFTADSTAKAAASASPISWGLGVAYGEVDTTATVTIDGHITTTGDAVIAATTDNTAMVKSSPSAIKGFSGAAAVSVFNSNATADVSHLAVLSIGGNLYVSGNRIDRNLTQATSATEPDGKADVAVAVSLATEQTNAYLDGTATVTGNIQVNANSQNISIQQNKLGIIPGTTGGISASAGVGGGTNSGDLVTDYKSAVVTKLTTPLKNGAIKLLTPIGKWFSERNPVKWILSKFPDSTGPAKADKFDFGAAVAFDEDYSQTTARIGDGTNAANVTSQGGISVTSQVSDNPSIQSQSSVSDDSSDTEATKDKTPVTESQEHGAVGKANDAEAAKKPQTQNGIAIAVVVDLVHDDAYAYISNHATVSAVTAVTVNAQSLNQISPSSLELWNLVSPFLSSNYGATYNSGDTGQTTVNSGDTIDVLSGYAGGGNGGDRYEYMGTTQTSINLSTADYSNTTLWKDLGAPAQQDYNTGDTGHTYVTNGTMVNVLNGFTGQGTAGHTYQYVGSPVSIDLTAANYTDTNSWKDLGTTAEQETKSFVGNLDTYLNDSFGLGYNLANSWSTATSQGQKNQISASVAFLLLEHTADARIKDGAVINQGSAYHNSAVSVTANAENDMINITGNFKVPGLSLDTSKSWVPSVEKPGFGTSKGAKAAGGGVMAQLDESNVTAKIEDGVTLYAGSLDVEAVTKNISINFTASGGKSDKLAFNGAITFSTAIDTTLAQIDSGATVVVGSGSVNPNDTVLVRADDTSVLVSIAGSVAESDATSVGLSGAVNLTGRSTQAVIGLAEGETAPSTLGSFTSGGNVEVDATNGGFVGGFAVAGSKSSGDSSQSKQGTGGTNNPGTGGTQGSNGTQQSNQDLASWQTKMGAVLSQAVAKGKLTGNIASTGTSEGGSTGQGSSSAVGISGSAGVDVLYDNADAYVRDTGAFSVTGTGGLTINAKNSTTTVNLAGSVAYAGSTNNSSATAISGAAAINIMSGETNAFIDGATSLALAGALDIESKRTGWTISIAAGFAGATGKDGKAVAGSAGVNIITYTTEAILENIAGTSAHPEALIGGAVTLNADDESSLVSIGGSGGFGGKAGVGVAVGFTYENNTTQAEIANVTGYNGPGLSAAGSINPGRYSRSRSRRRARWAWPRAGAAGRVTPERAPSQLTPF